METIKVNTSQHVDIDYPVAGLGERIAASLIDLVIFLLSFFLLKIVTSMPISVSASVSLILNLIFLAVFVFYSLLCEIFMKGQSIGKRLLKIKVISLDGARPRIGQYFIRWVFRLVDVWMTGVIGVISIAVSKEKQRIGDIVAGTTLIKTVLETKIEHIAFPTETTYTPVFTGIEALSDSDIETIYDVLNSYQKTHNPDLIYQTAKKVNSLLGLTLPEGMNELHFLQTIVKDHSHLTSRNI